MKISHKTIEKLLQMPKRIQRNFYNFSFCCSKKVCNIQFRGRVPTFSTLWNILLLALASNFVKLPYWTNWKPLKAKKKVFFTIIHQEIATQNFFSIKFFSRTKLVKHISDKKEKLLSPKLIKAKFSVSWWKVTLKRNKCFHIECHKTSPFCDNRNNFIDISLIVLCTFPSK